MMDQVKPTEAQPEFTQLIDLAAGRLGGLPIYANDEFFAEKENLVQPGRPATDSKHRALRRT